MSTASPDTCADVSGVATHRAASSREPYFETASSEELLLVRRGTPAAVDEELDAVVRGVRCGPAQGAEERRIEVGHGRNVVVEDRRAVGDGTVGLAQRTTVLTAQDVDRRRGRRRRGRQRLVAERADDRGDDDEQAGDEDPGHPTGRRSRGCAEVTPPVKAARCCRPVCGFRYAGDMRRLVTIGARVC